MLERNKIHFGDCLNLMDEIDDGAVNLILADLPYETTSCEWDKMIPPDELWKRWQRIIHPENGTIVLTASQPFTSIMVMSNRPWFRVEWIWEKTIAANFVQAKRRPLKLHENIIVFSPTPRFTYNPQLRYDKAYTRNSGKRKASILSQSKAVKNRILTTDKSTRYPGSVIKFPNGNSKNDHPTQKPLPLFVYLILTYSNPGELVLDCCAGSGTTALAAIDTDREWICMESWPEFYESSLLRIETRLKQPRLFGVDA